LFVIDNMIPIGKAYYQYALQVNPYLYLNYEEFTHSVNQRKQTNIECSKFIKEQTGKNDDLWKNQYCFAFGQWMSLMIFNDQYMKE